MKTGRNDIQILTKIMNETYWEEANVDDFLSKEVVEVSQGLNSPIFKSNRKRTISPKNDLVAKMRCEILDQFENHMKKIFTRI